MGNWGWFALAIILGGCAPTQRRVDADIPRTRAFCVDFNWGAGGVNGFAPPGMWADADPARHVAWYAALGANVIQTFAVSCNGYAWYRSGKVPSQPGLKHDFLREVVRLGHDRGMLVMGYFCISANTRWGAEHPHLSYGTPSAHHLPFTDEYLDYLGVAIDDAFRTTGIDGTMIDWVWCPTGEVRQKQNGGKWLDAEKRLYLQLTGKPFPGEDRLTPEDRLVYERLAVDRCWGRIRAAAKRAKPNCVLWLSCNKVKDPTVANSSLFREIDWLMNEAPDLEALGRTRGMVGPGARIVQCVVGWGDRHDARAVVTDPAWSGLDLYGFAKPGPDSLPLPVAEYLGKPIDAFRGNDRNIAVLARFFNGRTVERAAPPGNKSGT